MSGGEAFVLGGQMSRGGFCAGVKCPSAGAGKNWLVYVNILSQKSDISG